MSEATTEAVLATLEDLRVDRDRLRDINAEFVEVCQEALRALRSHGSGPMADHNDPTRQRMIALIAKAQEK